MFKITIIPDTNVMLSNLALIKQLYSCQFPLPYTVNFSKTVMSELESMKKSKVEARNAIRFLEKIANSLTTEIEGQIDEMKIDVIVEGRDPIKVTNNDDIILNYCFQLENPVFLTNDKAFYLKCLSYNIKSVIVGNKDIKILIKSILEEFGLGGNNEIKQVEKDYVFRICRLLKQTLLPTIILILQKELGAGYETVIHPDDCLPYYLSFVVDNFYLFRNFLPAQSPVIIKKFLQNLKDENIEEVKQMIHPICMIFRKAAPEEIN